MSPAPFFHSGYKENMRKTPDVVNKAETPSGASALRANPKRARHGGDVDTISRDEDKPRETEDKPSAISLSSDLQAIRESQTWEFWLIENVDSDGIQMMIDHESIQPISVSKVTIPSCMNCPTGFCPFPRFNVARSTDARTLTLWERVGLHDVQKSLHHVEQDPNRPRFVVGHCLVNSRRHITEVQLSRGWEPPRLRLLLEFAGRQKRPQQDEDPGLEHRAEVTPGLTVKPGLNRSPRGECKVEGDWSLVSPINGGGR